jgi:hypothetical protein
MNEAIQTETKRYHCRHIFTDGHRCGSPALRNEPFCYYHHTTRKPAPRQSLGRKSSFDLPLPEDRSAIQLAIGTILQRIASNDLDSRRAGLLLYGLQIASLNLPKQKEAQEPVEEITTHPELGTLAPQTEIKEEKSTVARLLEELRQKPAVLPQIQATEDPTPAKENLRMRLRSGRSRLRLRRLRRRRSLTLLLRRRSLLRLGNSLPENLDSRNIMRMERVLGNISPADNPIDVLARTALIDDKRVVRAAALHLRMHTRRGGRWMDIRG